MAERTGWVQPPQSLLFVEIRYRVFGVGFLENIRGRVFGKYNKSGGMLGNFVFEGGLG